MAEGFETFYVVACEPFRFETIQEVGAKIRLRGALF